MKLRSLVQLHSYRGRRSGAMPFACTQQQRSNVVEAQKALPISATTRNRGSGGLQGTREGSIPSSTTEYLNNDRVVQRRRAGQRNHNRPAPSSPLDKSPARSGGTLAPTLFVSSELLR